MPEKSKAGSKTRRKTTAKKVRPTKDRVLQARIPSHLDHQLRDRAESLGLSVSTIVRNVLMNTFDLVEDIVTDSAQISRVVRGAAADTKPAAEPAEGEIVAWQESVLNLNGVCEHCNTLLSRGSRAAIGVPTGPRPSLLCLDCLAALASAADGKKPEDSP